MLELPTPDAGQAEPVRWGLLGTGAMAARFLETAREVRGAQVVAVGSREIAKARELCLREGVDSAYGDYSELLGAPAVEAVYVALPHVMHLQWVLESLRAGKHVLCEKPLGMNAAEVAAMVGEASKRQLLLAEGLMYRYHSQTLQLRKIVRSGLLGAVQLIRAEFGFCAPRNGSSRLFDPELGGGAILDVGCYPISAARMIAGEAAGMAFVEPTVVNGHLWRGLTGVDECSVAMLRFEEPSLKAPIVAQVAAAIGTSFRNVLEIHGTAGLLIIPNPWTHDTAVREHLIHYVDLERSRHRRIRIGTENAYQRQLEAVSAHIRQGVCQPSERQISWQDSCGNAAVLDAWRSECEGWESAKAQLES